jgi:hypothetical protein
LGYLINYNTRCFHHWRWWYIDPCPGGRRMHEAITRAEAYLALGREKRRKIRSCKARKAREEEKFHRRDTEFAVRVYLDDKSLLRVPLRAFRGEASEKFAMPAEI